MPKKTKNRRATRFRYANLNINLLEQKNTRHIFKIQQVKKTQIISQHCHYYQI